MSTGFVTTTRTTIRIRDIPIVLLAPTRVFRRVEDVVAYGWHLTILLVTITLLGLATIETGLVDREVDNQVQQKIAEIEKQQFDVVERSKLSTMIQDAKKEGEFLRLMTRIQVIAANPLALLCTVLLLSALFYAAVALTGKKPEWHTLLTIFVFAGFTTVVGSFIRLGFMLHFRTLEVDTSLAPLVKWMAFEGNNAGVTSALLAGLFTAFDPFRIWFWLVAIIGLSTTAQLRGWKVWTLCVLLWLSAAGIRGVMAATMNGSVT